MKQRPPRKRKPSARRQQRALVVIVKESSEPVDVEAFCDACARLLIREAQERGWLGPLYVHQAVLRIIDRRDSRPRNVR